MAMTQQAIMPVESRPLDACDRRLIAAIQSGLPLTPQPYADIATELGISEDDVITRLQALIKTGLIKRFGVVVRHHELGYRANAMVVWNIPDQHIERIGRLFSEFSFVTLCYQRPRRLPNWPYNLFCMIHGTDHDQVIAKVAELVEHCGLHDINHDVLFSQRRFKQRGARYNSRASAETLPTISRKIEHG